MDNDSREKLRAFLQKRIAEAEQAASDLCQMEEFVNCGYVDIRPVPVGHDEGYENYAGKLTAWVTPQCPSGDREAATAVVKKLEDNGYKGNAYFKTSTPITSVLFVNICKAVRSALEGEKQALQEALEMA